MILWRRDKKSVSAVVFGVLYQVVELTFGGILACYVSCRDCDVIEVL
ncbi:MAG: hypothetical protein IGS39_19400 [Calothrix sp. C42_A2020_038]|nr:hypothetical protein [Calothrix sp. C42_A2020_038]